MKTNTLDIIIIESENGYLLTNGNTFTRKVYLGVNDTIENWWEVKDEGQLKEMDKTSDTEVPVRHYSKYLIQLSCQRRGLWEQVKQAIQEAGLSDSWSNIIDLSSDNTELQFALPIIKGIFGDAVVDAVLMESCVNESRME